MVPESIPYEQRYVVAQVRPGGVLPAYVDFELGQSVCGLRSVRVAQEHWLTPSWASELKHGETYSIFLYRVSSEARTSNQHGHWFGSARWADRTANPWDKDHPLHPQLGQVVQGSVVRLGASDTAIVRIDGHAGAAGLMEAVLRKSEVPGLNSSTSLEDLFPIGLQIEALIDKVESSVCKLELSVKGRVGRLINYSKQREISERPSKPRHHPQTEHLCLYDEPVGNEYFEDYFRHSHPDIGVSAQQSWKGYQIVLADDDSDFLRMLQAWFSKAGARVWIAQNLDSFRQVIAGEAQYATHVMVDYGMGGRVSLKEMVQTLRSIQKDQRQLSLMTGAVDIDAREFARRIDLPMFRKPLVVSQVHAWLTEGRHPSADEPEAGREWEISGPMVPWTDRVTAWLKDLCVALNAQGAMWVKVRTSVKGVQSYTVRAAWGVPVPRGGVGHRMDWSVLEARLGQTLVTHTLTNGEDRTTSKLDSGQLLAAYFPHGAIWVHSAMLSEQHASVLGQRTPDQEVLICFDAQHDNLKQRTMWPLMKTWWKDLVSIELLQEHVKAEAAFATLGRVHAATQHEISSLITPLTHSVPWSAEEAVGWWPNGVKVAHFVRGGLYQIKPDRANLINLRERMHTLMHDFLWLLAAKRKVRVEVYLPIEHTMVALPPEVIEQPLINMVDNATKEMQKTTRLWGAVRVRVELHTDAILPLVISVEDDGMGLTPDVERDCFEPRHSHSGGFGMGLYVSRTLARKAGGDVILARNLRWVGARFELRLPLPLGLAVVQQY